eukprot:4686457-Heterocapsa_arctica.AAC.1
MSGRSPLLGTQTRAGLSTGASSTGLSTGRALNGCVKCVKLGHARSEDALFGQGCARRSRVSRGFCKSRARLLPRGTFGRSASPAQVG